MITEKEIEKIAMLAKLYVKEEEYASLVSDLQQMTEFADVVKEAVVSDAAENSEFERSFFGREDKASDSFDRKQILSNAPLSDGEFFLVRKRA